MEKIYTLFTIAIFSTIEVVAQCSGRYQTNIYPTVDVTTVQYGSNMDLNNNVVDLFMDIYQPQGDTATSRPLVIFAHGGSFSAGSRTSPELVHFATELAKKGYICASISYRLAPSAFSLLAEETTFKVVFGAIQDGKAAIRYFRQDAANANLYKIDEEQIFIGGTSAGGILAFNLVYGDDVNKLPAQWQTWLSEIGGLEGSSGNPGYCSRASGTFGFAGGVADTAWINGDDVPLYACHTFGDQTVLYDYGQPLNGFTPVNLYGSGPINTRMDGQGIYNHLDPYTGSDHPPFANSTPILDTTNTNLTAFLYNILDCNPSNLKNPNQKDCSTFVGVNEFDKQHIELLVYPNPAVEFITIDLKEMNSANNVVEITNTLGQVVFTQTANENMLKVNVSAFPNGAYIVNVNGVSQLFIKK